MTQLIGQPAKRPPVPVGPFKSGLAAANNTIKTWTGVAGGVYHLIDTYPKWVWFYNKLKTKLCAAMDTEATGLKFVTSDIVGISISWGAADSYYIPVRHSKLIRDGGTDKKPLWRDVPSDEKQLSIDQIFEDLYNWLANPKVTTIWHNWKFDCHLMRKDGFIPKGIIHDTMLQHNLLNENDSSKLKDLACTLIHKDANRWEADIDEFRAKFGRKHKIPKKDVHYGLVPIDKMTPYAASDAHYTWALHKLFLPEIIENPEIRNLYVSIEMQLVQALIEMEKVGFCIDRDYFKEVQPKLEVEIAEAKKVFLSKLGNDQVNLNSPKQLIPALQKKGVKFKKKTKGGSFSLDAEVLNDLSRRYDLCEDLLTYRNLVKKKTTYVDSLLNKSVVDGVIHSNFNQNVRTGRLCIAEGTAVQTPCDRNQYPQGKPIEQIKKGDYVYTYTKDGELLLRKVLWSGQTGIKDTVKIEWRGSGHKHSGELYLTPDHKVRLFNGEWCKAKDLKPKDRVMALHALTKKQYGYSYLYARQGKELKEHRFIKSQFQNIENLVVHHRDGNKVNNNLDNLRLTTLSDHASEHLLQRPDSVRAHYADHLQLPHNRKKQLDSITQGEEHPSWKNIPRVTLLKWAASCAGKIKKIMNLSGMDFEVLKRKYKLANIDLKTISMRYGSDEKFISYQRFCRALELGRSKCRKLLNISYPKFKYLCEFYQVENNHEIVSISKGPTVPVYNLEVEETHAFIANELCVSNSGSDPNLMNIPGRDALIRSGFVPPHHYSCPECSWQAYTRLAFVNCPNCGHRGVGIDKDFFLLLIDYSQVEVRLTAHYSEDPILLKVYQEGIEDVHTRTLCEMFDLDYVEVIKILRDENHPQHKEMSQKRKIAKMINFLIIYGGQAYSLSTKISTPDKAYSEDECQIFIDNYLNKYLGVKRWIARTKIQARKDCFTKNHFGRIRRLPDLELAPRASFDNLIRRRVEHALRQAVNYQIQGTCADIFKIAMVRVHKILKGTRSKLVTPIHDEIIMYMHRSDIKLLPEIKRQMEDFDFRVPIVADICWATTNWAEKRELLLN